MFEGLDTVATVALGGDELGRTANMHRTYRFDVGRLLTAEGADLSVTFAPALEHARAQEQVLGARPHTNAHPYNAIRKAAFGFGWDWGPDLQTAGLWRPVTLQRWRTARLASVRPLVTLDDDGIGRVVVHAEIERAPGVSGPFTLTATVGDGSDQVTGTSTVGDRDTATLTLTVPGAPVWWPVGHGTQPLVALSISLLHDDRTVDASGHRIGFRSVRVDEPVDDTGRGFGLVVNGRPVFVRGVNWVPDEALLTGLTRDHYEVAVRRAVAANANLLRVWGGGVYESREFYETCDELGVLVWQDFALACAAYAEEEPLRREILAEARENVTRLSPHPSLVLWNGGNENLWHHEIRGWDEQLAGRSWGHGYCTDEFPRLLRELDPTRPYLMGSPSSPGHDASDVPPNDEHHGIRHEWDVWNSLDYTAHHEHVPRFCAEFGWQAPPAWSTLLHALDGQPPSKASPAFESHQKANRGTAKLDAGLEAHFGLPEDFGDWHWATQLNQARATAFAIEHFRASAPRTRGCVLWQLNDCWPVTSWSMVDASGRLKPAWFALRRAYAPRLLSVRPRGDGLEVVVVNDSDEPFAGVLTLRRIAFDGSVQAGVSVRHDVPARSTQALGVPPALATPSDPAAETLVAEALPVGVPATGVLRATHLFARDRDLTYESRPWRASTRKTRDGYAVTVTARSFSRDVTVLADRAHPDAVVDEALVTLLAGESFTFRVRTPGPVPTEVLIGPDVLRSANDLVPVIRPAARQPLPAP